MKIRIKLFVLSDIKILCSLIFFFKNTKTLHMLFTGIKSMVVKTTPGKYFRSVTDLEKLRHQQILLS